MSIISHYSYVKKILSTIADTSIFIAGVLRQKKFFNYITVINGDCEMTFVFIGLFAVISSQCIHIASYVVYFLSIYNIFIKYT